MSECQIGRSACTPDHRMCATLGDCPDHYQAVLAAYPAGTTVTNMGTGAMYVDIDRLTRKKGYRHGTSWLTWTGKGARRA